MFPHRASAAMLAACLLAASCVQVAAGEPSSGTVVSVYDGDTISSRAWSHTCSARSRNIIPNRVITLYGLPLHHQ